MKTIGLIGGTSWESTVIYYQELNTLAKKKLGGLHSARILLHSVDFADFAAAMDAGRWDLVEDGLVQAAQSLEAGGANFVLICTNTMHCVADEVQRRIKLPLLHIADATAAALQRDGITRAAMLGSCTTMEQPFYAKKLGGAGIEMMVPPEEARKRMDEIIFGELCRGQFLRSSRQFMLQQIDELAAQGAQAAILGCTEIPLLVNQADSALPLYDTARLHAAAAMDFALR